MRRDSGNSICYGGIASTLDSRIYPIDNRSGSIHFRAQLPQAREADACAGSSPVKRKGPLRLMTKSLLEDTTKLAASEGEH